MLGISAIIDSTVLMVTIWSGPLQDQQPPAVYLKAPTLFHVFIMIALRPGEAHIVEAAVVMLDLRNFTRLSNHCGLHPPSGC